MKPIRSGFPPATGYLVIAALVMLLAIACGCTQQSPNPEVTQSGIKVTQPDDSHITVAFVGGQDDLLEMEVTVTDSQGKIFTMSKGSRLGTTPLPIRSTISFTGPYGGRDHVLVTGYFVNQTTMTLVDTGI